MIDNSVVALKDYGQIVLHVKVIMDGSNMTRGGLSKLANIRFEVADKWYNGNHYLCHVDGNKMAIYYNYRGGNEMRDRFIVHPRNLDKKGDKSITMTIRIDRDIQQKYDSLSGKSNRSRNELICMALCYALDNLEFINNSHISDSASSLS